MRPTTRACFVFPNGARRITYAYLERDTDAEAYQGWSDDARLHRGSRQLSLAGTDPQGFMATLRSGAGVPVGMRLTGNPGGKRAPVGSARATSIQRLSLGWRVLRDATGLERIYIPSRVADNLYLGSDYVQRLQASGSAGTGARVAVRRLDGC